MSQATKKSGKGNSHGVISEVSAYLTVKPGHEEEARAACQRFGEMLKKSGMSQALEVVPADYCPWCGEPIEPCREK